MADIRYLNQFGMPGGFNITSGEPIDSRAYVADINHIYSEDNWKTVKPYKGLIVSAPDGQVRICVDDKNYTSADAWKEVGAGAGSIQVETYEEAIAAANSDKLGQIVYITTDGSFGEGESVIEYTAGAYIVTGDGALAKLGTTSVSGDIAGDVATLKGDVATLKGDVKELGEDTSELRDYVEGLQTTTWDLQTALNGDGSENPGLISRVESLEGIDHTQYENTIETIKVNGVEVSPVEKVVDITIDAPVYDETIGETPSNTTAPTTSAVKTYVDAVKSNIDGIVNSLEGKVNAIETWKLEVVEANENGYPNISGEISHKTIYLVPSASHGDNNIYSEFVYIDNGEADYWEKLGEFKSDFDPTGLNTAIEGLGTRVGNIETKLANYDALSDQVESNSQSIKGIEDNIAQNFGSFSSQLQTISGKVDTLEKNSITDVIVDGVSVVTDTTATIPIAAGVTYDPDGTVGGAATAGLMSADDKVKLDDIEEGAQVNTIESITINNGEAIEIVDKNVNINIEVITEDDINKILGLTPTE